MLYRKLGSTGVPVSLLSYGSWITFGQMSLAEIQTLISYGFEHGINLFDSAEVYGEGLAENNLGHILNQLSIPREKYLISTKVFWGGTSPTESGLTRKHIIEGCHKSLRRLQIDYIDFYLCHRPDYSAPIIETVIAMNLLIQQGKILYWGTSEWPNELIIEAYYIAKQNNLIPPSVEQTEYNLFCREKVETQLPRIQDMTGIGICASMPLACGILAGRYNKGIPADSRAAIKSHPCFNNMILSDDGKEKIEQAKKLEIYAKHHKTTLANLALLWCMSNQRVSSVILGTNKLAQLKQNIDALNYMNDKTTLTFIEDVNHILQNKPSAYYEPSYAEVIAES